MANDIEDISTLIGGYYDQKKSHSGEFEVGQVVFVPVLETRRRPWIADAIRADSYTHQEVSLEVREQNGGDFKGKEKRTPIKALHLDENHELVLSRAKCRPCLILGKSDGVDSTSIPEGKQRHKALNAFSPKFIIAPVFSCSTPHKHTSFGPVMTARIKCMMYPQFLYMPRSGGILQVSSVARLDEMFVHSLEVVADDTGLFVIDEIMAMAHEQIKILIGKEATKEYKDARELLLDCLDEQYK